MKNGKTNGYRTYKKVLIAIGAVAALVLLHTIIFMLIPFIMESHVF